MNKITVGLAVVARTVPSRALASKQMFVPDDVNAVRREDPRGPGRGGRAQCVSQ